MKIRYHKQYTNIVKIHNNLIEAHYKFTKEQQVILLQVAKTLQERDIFDKHEHSKVTYQANELLSYLNISDRRTLRAVIKSLQCCIMSYENLDEEWEADVNIFMYSKYHKGGKIDIEIHREMLPFLKQLHSNYTELNLKELVQFKSQYTIRLYELARKFQNIGITKNTKKFKQEKIYTLEEFQNLMGSNYNTWQRLETFVLKPAMEELKDNSFIHIDYKPIKGYKKGQTRGRQGIVEIKLLINRIGHFTG